MRKLIIKIAILVMALTPLASFSSTPRPDADEILRRVDQYRNPLHFFSVDVDLKLFHRDENDEFSFRVYGNGTDGNLLEFRAPAADKGKYYLMLKDDMWIYLPDASRPIRISPLQRLAGEASNGDVVRTAFTVDYTAELTGEDTVDERKALVLSLKGRNADMSYSTVKLWVAAESFEPIQAEFYALSGHLLKRAYFRTFGTMLGCRVVTSIEIQDAIRPDHKTVMTYSNLTSKHYPAKMFSQAYLGRW